MPNFSPRGRSRPSSKCHPPNGKFFESVDFCRSEDVARAVMIRADLRKRSPGFDKAVPESWNRARSLLHAIQGGYITGKARPTLASALNMREVRATVIGSLLKAVEHLPSDHLRTVTVINRKWYLTAKQLRKTPASRIKRQFRTHLERAGILAMPGFLVAFIHGEWEPTSKRFQVHFHTLTTAAKAAAILVKLRGRNGYIKTATGADPIRRSAVRDRRKQFSYLLKAFWPQRAVFEINGEAMRARRGVRIKHRAHTDHLLWLHEATLSDLMLTSKCRFRNGSFYGV